MAAEPSVADPMHAPSEPAEASSAFGENGRAASGLVVIRSEARDASGVYAEGLLAGLVGAAVIALWFLVLDLINRHPLYTPNLLGTALLGGGEDIADPRALPISLDMVIGFTWIHVLAFLLIGVAASHLLALAEREPNFGFGILLLFVVFQFGFLAVSMVLAEPELHALVWPEVVGGNLLAAGAMAAIFWRRHPHLLVDP